MSLALTADHAKPGQCYLSHIGVHDSARGKGVGKILMDRADYEAKARNCKVRKFLHIFSVYVFKDMYICIHNIITTCTCMCY